MSASACLLVLTTVITMATAQGGYGQIIPIVRDDRTQNPYGENRFEFEAGNGIVRYETGSENDGHVQGEAGDTSPPRASPSRSPSWPTRGVTSPRGICSPWPPLSHTKGLRTSVAAEDMPEGRGT
nr:uncharacterized protein LOC113816623 [Penaeus vannamei]